MAEYSVHNEPDFERTYDEDEIVQIRKGDLRACLDVSTMSMDFGSGFLDNEQVEALRKVAVLIGIDPAYATPSNFECLYGARSHTFRDYYGAYKCMGCGTPATLEEEIKEAEQRRAASLAKYPIETRKLLP